MKFLNLTAEPINFIREDGTSFEIPVSGRLARACIEKGNTGVSFNGIPVIKKVSGAVIDLPDEDEDTILLVSEAVAEAVREWYRRDIFVPTHERWEDGKKIGYMALERVR